MTLTAHRSPLIAIIVATSSNNCIGINNELQWHIPGDLKRLKEITMGKPLVMGRKTHESVSARREGKPLPGRVHFVISRSITQPQIEGVFVCRSLEEAITGALNYATANAQDEIIIFGGAEIYKQAFQAGLVDKIYLTKVHAHVNGDAFFPALDANQWHEVSSEDHETGDGLKYSYVTLLSL